MKLSVFTTATNPVSRGDLFDEAMDCYRDLADEVIYIDGSGDFKDGQKIQYEDKTIEVYSHWPKEFSWKLIGNQFQKGYEACTGDWVIHADLDFIFHQDDFERIRRACEDNPEAPALSFWKYQFILPDRYNLKSRLVIAVNKKKYGDRIRFDSGGDLCQPSLDGANIRPDDVPQSRVPIYNYEKILKTKEQVMDDVGRMERAYRRHFNETQYGSDGTDEHAYKLWLKAQLGKFAKPQKTIPLSSHPKYIQKTIKNLTPEQFGYDGHGRLGRNIYV